MRSSVTTATGEQWVGKELVPGAARDDQYVLVEQGQLLAADRPGLRGKPEAEVGEGLAPREWSWR